ncbi:VapC toxin family PIN domain ribonuclease [Sphingomonas gilva]|uniref:VapC toxin family PIN domain ribonuclease n=1 Tax=Sphingomonas gilva TaxID=2305907 RepID=A0A396RQ83_9SPHN|nr:VapC toxin family PIN domain ribonuclease [Sphingomonas gilva]RHW18076.1 VapC toxin family PIN domain ribonuclease [Sphingomonas gilva]
MARRIIADSAIWIDHLGKGDAELAAQLKRRRILLHPMIIGEVALGSIARRRIVLEELQALPQAAPASHAEVMAMIEWLGLFDCGIGYVDAHLLTAPRAAGPDNPVSLWTRDKRLRAQAERLGVAADLD